MACFVLRSTSAADKVRSETVKTLWGSECDYLEFIDSNTKYIQVDWVEGRSTLAHKSFRGWMYMYEKYGPESDLTLPVDFFLKADLDTYIIGTNFRPYLAKFKAQEPHYIGRQFRYKSSYDFVAGAAIILSRASLQRFKVASTNELSSCGRQSYGPAQYEDVALGRCLRELGILPHNTRDGLGRERFMVFDPDDVYNVTFGRLHDGWYPSHSYTPHFDRRCCSSDAVVFHRIHEEHWGSDLAYIDGYWMWKVDKD